MLLLFFIKYCNSHNLVFIVTTDPLEIESRRNDLFSYHWNTPWYNTQYFKTQWHYQEDFERHFFPEISFPRCMLIDSNTSRLTWQNSQQYFLESLGRMQVFRIILKLWLALEDQNIQIELENTTLVFFACFCFFCQVHDKYHLKQWKNNTIIHLTC